MLQKVDAPPQGEPDLQVEHWPISRLLAYANNSRDHSPEQVAEIAASIRKFKFVNPCLVDAAGVLIAGHGRLAAARLLGMESVPVIRLGHLSEADARALRIADNSIALNATWNLVALKSELEGLKALDYDLKVLAFPEIKLVEFMTGMPSNEPGSTPDEDRARKLALLKVTIDDPKHVVEKGDHWVLDKRHHLFCVGVVRDWPIWSPLLTGDALFCPYPGVFVPFGERAADHVLVMVQPDVYIAGHMLDRYAEVNGKKSVKKVEQ